MKLVKKTVESDIVDIPTEQIKSIINNGKKVGKQFKNDLFSRLFENVADMDASISPTVFIIGCGGIGSWVSKIIGTSQHVQHIFLFDPDIVEISNLARTPFRVDDINFKKSDVMAQQILETNPTCTVYPISKYFDKSSVESVKEIINGVFKSESLSSITIIDCRDNDFQDHDLMMSFSSITPDIRLIRTAYDGTVITMDFTPAGRPVWGERGYSVQPSHVLPSFVAAMMAVVMAFSYNHIKTNYKFIFENPITFDCMDIIPSMFLSIKTKSCADKGDDFYALIMKRWTVGDFKILKKKGKK